ncbi:MAG TPA: hypothetical protein VE505_20975 [Vicinamibacterales bacterium]|nr:hypothetical protein [Vicinamibacterales bacterium]
MHDALNGSGNQEISAHDALELSLVEYTFGSGEPPSSRRHRAAPYQSKPRPEGGTRRRFVVASIKEHLMCVRHGAFALVIASHQVGCHREPLKVFGFQRGLAPGRLQQPVRFAPNFVTFPLPAAGPLVTLQTSAGRSGAVHIDFVAPTISDGIQFDVMFRLVDSLTSPTNELRTGCFTVTVK